jgi:hypothetical protein
MIDVIRQVHSSVMHLDLYIWIILLSLNCTFLKQKRNVHVEEMNISVNNIVMTYSLFIESSRRTKLSILMEMTNCEDLGRV